MLHRCTMCYQHIVESEQLDVKLQTYKLIGDHTLLPDFWPLMFPSYTNDALFFSMDKIGIYLPLSSVWSRLDTDAIKVYFYLQTIQK